MGLSLSDCGILQKEMNNLMRISPSGVLPRRVSKTPLAGAALDARDSADCSPRSTPVTAHRTPIPVGGVGARTPRRHRARRVTRRAGAKD